jgi:hypothetical protein
MRRFDHLDNQLSTNKLLMKDVADQADDTVMIVNIRCRGNLSRSGL